LDDALWHYPDLWQPSLQLCHLQAQVTSTAYPIQPEQAALPASPVVKKEKEREKEKAVRSSQKNGQRALDSANQLLSQIDSAININLDDLQTENATASTKQDAHSATTSRKAHGGAKGSQPFPRAVVYVYLLVLAMFLLVVWLRQPHAGQAARRLMDAGMAFAAPPPPSGPIDALDLTVTLVGIGLPHLNAAARRQFKNAVVDAAGLPAASVVVSHYSDASGALHAEVTLSATHNRLLGVNALLREDSFPGFLAAMLQARGFATVHRANVKVEHMSSVHACVRCATVAAVHHHHNQATGAATGAAVAAAAGAAAAGGDGSGSGGVAASGEGPAAAHAVQTSNAAIPVDMLNPGYTVDKRLLAGTAAVGAGTV
jgi:hypothetical protein